MKKSWCMFWTVSILGAAAVGTCAALTARLSKMLCCVCLLVGAAAWLICYFHFRSIEYSVENKRLIIRRGILIKSTTSVKISDILWHGAAKFSSATLFSVIYTAAGRIYVFAEMNIENFKNGEF